MPFFAFSGIFTNYLIVSGTGKQTIWD